MLASSFAHVPVLFEETLELLAVTPGGRYCDGTAGGAGHARGILERSAPDGLLLAVDRDPEAITHCRSALAEFGPRATIRQGNYTEIPEILVDIGWLEVDGVVLDLGVSSHQLDCAERGFSFSNSGPIDMRMGPDAATARSLLETLDERELADVIYEFGEERASRRVARAIKAALAAGELEDTAALARVVAQAVGRSVGAKRSVGEKRSVAARKSRIHPATRTFQALRIAANNELDALDRFLEGMLELVRVGGRVAVIAFHSLEDRRVKRRFAELSGRRTHPPGQPLSPLPEVEPAPRARLLTRKAVQAGDEETRDNPRARSARLRAVERLR